jgi:predicted ATP-binding protein involved in virulence
MRYRIEMSYTKSLTNIIREKNQELYARLLTIREKSRSVLHFAQAKFPYYAPRGSHGDNVLENLNWLLPEELKRELNSAEIFFLIVAAWLHDFGLVGSLELSEEVRHNHHIRTEGMLEKYHSDIDMTLNEAVIVGRICRGHGKEDLNDKKYEDLMFGNVRIHTRFLTAVLRIAVDIDLTANRMPEVFYHEISSTEKAEEKFREDMSIIGIGYVSDGERDRLVLHAIAWSPLTVAVIKKLQKEIQDDLDQVTTILTAGINGKRMMLRTIELRIDTRGFIGDIGSESGRSADAKRLGTQAGKCVSIRLKRLTLNNIRCFEHLELLFSDNDSQRLWTLLVGDNAVGKTTILQCIALCALGPMLAQRINISPQNMLRSGSDHGFIEAAFEVDKETESHFTPSVTVVRLDIEKGNRTIWFDRQNEDLRLFTDLRRRSDFRGWLVVGYGASRNLLFTDQPFKILQKDLIIDRVESLFNPTKILVDPSSLNRFLVGDLSPFEEMGAPRRLGSRSVKQVRDLYSRLLPMMSWTDPAKDGCLVTSSGRVPISELSDGYKSMLSWVSHLIMHLFATLDWKGDISKVEGIVLIDEIDLHLHPKWQRTVINSLRDAFPKLQFVATSHSPMTVGGLNTGKGEIALLKESDSGIEVHKDLPSIKGWRADQILTGPLFDLDSSRDVDTERLLGCYTELVVKDKISGLEKRELEGIAKELRIRLPSSSEKKEAREAYSLLRESLEQQWNKKPIEEKRKILGELKIQLLEIMTGSEVSK